MAEVIIKTLKNDPLEIWGGAKIVDEAGKGYSESRNEPLYLCRCGHSRTRPFATIPKRRAASMPKRRQARQSFRQYSITPILEHSNGGVIGAMECWTDD